MLAVLPLQHHLGPQGVHLLIHIAFELGQNTDRLIRVTPSSAPLCLRSVSLTSRGEPSKQKRKNLSQNFCISHSIIFQGASSTLNHL